MCCLLHLQKSQHQWPWSSKNVTMVGAKAKADFKLSGHEHEHERTHFSHFFGVLLSFRGARNFFGCIFALAFLCFFNVALIANDILSACYCLHTVYDSFFLLSFCVRRQCWSMNVVWIEFESSTMTTGGGRDKKMFVYAWIYSQPKIKLCKTELWTGASERRETKATPAYLTIVFFFWVVPHGSLMR